MKNTIYILSMLIIFQSCYTYKTFDIKNYETIKSEKVKIKLKNSRVLKGKPVSFTNDTLKLKTISKVEKIAISNINSIKQQKYSWVKSYLLSATISVTVLAILLNELLNGIKISGS